MAAFPRFFLLYPTGGGFEITEPARWFRDNPDSPALAGAWDRLQAPVDSLDDKRLVAFVLRRCKLVLVCWTAPARVAVSYWSHAQTPRLHLWLKEHALLRDDVEVAAMRLKHGVVAVGRGSDHLEGEPLPDAFAWEEYRRHFELRGRGEPFTGTAPVWVTYCWPGEEPNRLLWEVLRHAWRDEFATCPNCDQPLCLYCIDYVRCGFSNWCGRESRFYFGCRRGFTKSLSGFPRALRSLPRELRPNIWTGFGWKPVIELKNGGFGRPREWKDE